LQPKANAIGFCSSSENKKGILKKMADWTGRDWADISEREQG
jgi:hypothetical protein